MRAALFFSALPNGPLSSLPSSCFSFYQRRVCVDEQFVFFFFEIRRIRIIIENTKTRKSRAGGVRRDPAGARRACARSAIAIQCRQTRVIGRGDARAVQRAAIHYVQRK